MEGGFWGQASVRSTRYASYNDEYIPREEKNLLGVVNHGSGESRHYHGLLDLDVFASGTINSFTVRSVYMDNPIQEEFSDTVDFHTYKADLDVDSDFEYEPGIQHSIIEEKIEDINRPGQIVYLNDDDDDSDNIPDFADGYNLNGYGGNYISNPNENDFVEMHLKLDSIQTLISGNHIDPEEAKIDLFMLGPTRPLFKEQVLHLTVSIS